MYVMMLKLVLILTEEKELALQRSFGKPALFDGITLFGYWLVSIDNKPRG